MNITEGTKFIKGNSNIQKWWKGLSKEDLCPLLTRIMTEKIQWEQDRIRRKTDR